MVRHVAVYSKTNTEIFQSIDKEKNELEIILLSVKMIALLFRLMWHDVTNGLYLK
jgi:hypothetical protein